MATTIKKFVPLKKRYPWPKWTNGEAWRAKQGKDFSCTPEGFRSSLYSHAARKQLDVRITMKGATVEFQFASQQPN